MRSYYIIAVFLVTLFSVSDIFSQKRLPETSFIRLDTVKLSDLTTSNRLRSKPDSLLYKDEVLHKIILLNDLGDPALFSEVSTHSVELQVTAKLLINQGLVLLPGEAVVMAEVKIVHKPPVYYSGRDVDGSIEFDKYSVGSHVYQDDEYRLTAYLILDSLLTLPCYSVTYNDLVFGPIIIDGQAQKVITFKSNRREPVVISSLSTSIDKDAFSYKSQFPITLPPLGTMTAQITYAPTSTAPIVKYRHGMEIYFPATWDGNTCTSTTLTFAGTAIPPTADSIATPLFPDEKQILAFVGQMQPTIKTFHFTNNTAGNLKIISVSMKNGTSFRINNVTPSNTFPFDLAAGANMTVDVEMLDVSQGVHYDELIIVVDKAADAIHFELQGLQKEKALSVRSPAQNNVELVIYPNPTSGSTTFSLNGATSGKLEIVDVLGNTLYRTQFDNIHVWNGITARNTKLPAGSYIARVHSLDAANPFIASKIFIVQ